MKFRNIIHALTETGTYRHALFYHFPGGLRFGLSEGGEPLTQILTALRKATMICDEALGKGKSFLIHIQQFVSTSGFELRDTIQELCLAGIVIPKTRDVWYEEVCETDDSVGGFWINCVFEIQASYMENLLWCALVTDFPSVHPNPHCLIYLVNPEKSILIHPYDDRGLDVICRDSAVLATLYEKYNVWLLDYDKETMDQTFKPNTI